MCAADMLFLVFLRSRAAREARRALVRPECGGGGVSNGSRMRPRRAETVKYRSRGDSSVLRIWSVVGR